MKKGDRVFHSKFGPGTVKMVDEGSAIVRFDDNRIEECEQINLTVVVTPIERLTMTEWDKPVEVLNRSQALAIRSTNDGWGVFSRSRIELLPHQLWVCRKVN